MATNNELVVDPTYVYNQYDQTGAPDPNIPLIPPTGAFTTIQGLPGPSLTFAGGSTGYTFSGAGATITLTGAAASIRETGGPTTLTVGAIADGQVLTRNGTTVIGSSPSGLLATTSFNINTGTKQTLYTVPGGLSAVITAVLLRTASVDLSGGATARLTFGFDAGATDFGPQFFDPTILTAASLYRVFTQGDAAPAAASVRGTAGQIFGVITDSAFGSAATVIVEVFGNTF